MKRRIVVTLEAACGWLDNIPALYRYDGRWYIGTGCWGCYVFKLSEKSIALDDRWETGVWR